MKDTTTNSTRTQEEKDEMRDLIEQVKNLCTEVTYLRNQNNQLQNTQRNYQSYQGSNQGYQGNPPPHHDSSQGHNQGFDEGNQGYRNNNQGYQRKSWNTNPNNGGIPSPLDNPPSENRPADKVFLAEAALSRWCRLHETSQHSELQCHEFQRAADIFKGEVRNTTASENPPPTGYEIVPAPRYDQALVFDDFKLLVYD